MAAKREGPVVGGVATRGSSEGQTGIAASAGMETGGMAGVEEEAEAVSVSSTSRNWNRGGWSAGREDGNHMLLYI